MDFDLETGKFPGGSPDQDWGLGGDRVFLPKTKLLFSFGFWIWRNKKFIRINFNCTTSQRDSMQHSLQGQKESASEAECGHRQWRGISYSSIRLRSQWHYCFQLQYWQISSATQKDKILQMKLCASPIFCCLSPIKDAGWYQKLAIHHAE